jgi:hypothetical protein
MVVVFLGCPETRAPGGMKSTRLVRRSEIVRSKKSWGFFMGYPLKMVIEIVDLPIDNGDFPYVYIYILGGGIPTPLKNMRKSVGMMKFPIDGKS